MGNYRHAPERTQPTPIRPRCLDALDEAALRVLSTKLLDDLKEVRNRLNQGPETSSRPPSSRAPWDRPRGAREADVDPDVDADAAEGDLEPNPAEVKPA